MLHPSETSSTELYIATLLICTLFSNIIQISGYIQLTRSAKRPVAILPTSSCN